MAPAPPAAPRVSPARRAAGITPAARGAAYPCRIPMLQGAPPPARARVPPDTRVFAPAGAARPLTPRPPPGWIA